MEAAPGRNSPTAFLSRMGGGACAKTEEEDDWGGGGAQRVIFLPEGSMTVDEEDPLGLDGREGVREGGGA